MADELRKALIGGEDTVRLELLREIMAAMPTPVELGRLVGNALREAIESPEGQAHLRSTHVGAKVLKGVSKGGQERSARYAPFLARATAEADAIRARYPDRSINSMAEQLHRSMTPDQSGLKPSVRTIRRSLTDHFKKSR